MKLYLIAFTMAIFSFLIPASSLGLPVAPDVGPDQGCLFAQAVLDEIDKEELRIAFEAPSATQARKVILIVQLKTGDNLRKNTKAWQRENCIRTAPPPPPAPPVHPRQDHHPAAGLPPPLPRKG